MVLLNATGSNDQEVFLEALLSALSDFYNKQSDTNLKKLYRALAAVLTIVDRDVSALYHDNTLSARVPDELIERGTGSKDHLSQESAFAIDRIGFTATGQITTETHIIDDEETVITLRSKPLDYTALRIYSATDAQRVSVSEVLEFDEDANTVTVAGVDNPGPYILEYIDRGTIKQETETLQIPAELFQLGFNEGGFGNFGFGE